MVEDPRAALERAEAQHSIHAQPQTLRAMAANARERAQILEESARSMHHRADVYEDMAAQREGGA